MKELLELQSWVQERKKQDPTWELSNATVNFIIGLENDLEELSQTLGVDLCLMTISHK